MVADVRVRRGIQEETAAFVDALNATGLLPALPATIAALGQRGLPRAPLHEEVANLRWFVSWHGQRPVGVAAFRDVYDPHTSATVREVIHLAGSRRACVDLCRFLLDEAAIAGLPILATVDRDNAAMRAVLSQFGLVAERVTYAIGGER